MMMIFPYRREAKARRGDGEEWRLSEEAERHGSWGTHGHSLQTVGVDVDPERRRQGRAALDLHMILTSANY